MLTVAASIAFAVLWFAFEGPIGLLPALLVPLWIPIFTDQERPVSTTPVVPCWHLLW